MSVLYVYSYIIGGRIKHWVLICFIYVYNMKTLIAESLVKFITYVNMYVYLNEECQYE
jgi:hypothetical protein